MNSRTDRKLSKDATFNLRKLRKTRTDVVRSRSLSELNKKNVMLSLLTPKIFIERNELRLSPAGAERDSKKLQSLTGASLNEGTNKKAIDALLEHPRPGGLQEASDIQIFLRMTEREPAPGTNLDNASEVRRLIASEG